MKYSADTTELLREEINRPFGGRDLREYYMGIGYKRELNAPTPIARANAFRSCVTLAKPHIYKNDIIVGTCRSYYGDGVSDADFERYAAYNRRFGNRGFVHGADHYAPAYDRLLELGIPGIRREIAHSLIVHKDDRKRVEFLQSCDIAMQGFAEMLIGYGEAAEDAEIREVCFNLAQKRPNSFREALQLVWMSYIAFRHQRLDAMALGRLDQYLYPFYRRDIDAGVITRADAQLMLENTFMKFSNVGSDITNICVAGLTPEGEDATNDLSFDILRAVGKCNIPGPNLSARIDKLTPDAFLEEALTVIGTGLGYPALMNNRVNTDALIRMGYAERDANNFCMVGCIENFLPGMQPPWSDGRYDTVKLLEYTLNRGVDRITGKPAGIDVGDPREWRTMDEVIDAYKRQLADGASEYVSRMALEHDRYNPAEYVNPFMSCLTYRCVERGLDINNGGTIYPAAHGAGVMGIGTITDSLSAIETCIFRDKSLTWDELLDALRDNFEGHDETRKKLLDAPKYGNDLDEADKYAVWFVDYTAELFDKYRLADGGRFYTAIASNVQNISAGAECGASPDGRLAGEPQSDAASPTYGRDKRGPTRTVKSLTKPDYTKVACGTVVNQKYSPSIFSGEGNIKRLAALIRVYFERGGQEIQINSVSREVLLDAMEHPEKYESLVVRVSGFSAYYTRLNKKVQLDILSRTEQY